MASNTDHAYRPEQPDDSRSPCPALNSLANHGYLPRDGLNIGWWTLIRALVEVYSLSYPLAIFLSTIAVCFCGCWYKLPWTVDLHDLGWHNRIEHNVSTVHDDAKPGEKFAPSKPNKILLHHLLECAPGGTGLGIDEFVRARIRRAMQVKKPLDSVHKEIAHGESALTLLVLGQTKQGGSSSDKSLAIPRNFVEQWYGDERLPDGWKTPKKQVGFLRTVYMSQTIQARIRMQDYIARSA